ncbi:agmatine deiminase family protein [Rhodoferax aquaticus]|uniref:Agmatine deiminase family protein n=1 Tax=Rhodoferax aquaticus TaxID=2527691 RepID=A0A515EW73_9BURK|nr:agmatine deiminase family protein [Rhodoferax aquaticus]QDL56922.1 agmatine deiminase family protein [Rhodoferax aquaticus]
MLNRRRTLQSLAGLSMAMTQALPSLANTPATAAWRMPDEGEPHARTWMAFGAQLDIWGAELLPVVQQDLANIAMAIARFEPVSMLVRPSDMAKATSLLKGSRVELVEQMVDDFWMRDSGPVFVTNAQGKKAAVDFNFNGWGKKQKHTHDAKVAAFVAGRAGAQRMRTSLVLEGGGIEVDGHGTAIITESCVLNANRNPGVSKAACEAELKRLLGLEKILWLPGIKGKDITDGHTDFYARFASPGVVLAGYDPDPDSYDHAVTTRHLAMLREMTDARGKPLEVVVMEAPTTVREHYAGKDFAAGYINFYVCNGAVIAPQFGDRAADANARDTLKDLFPTREVVQLNVDGVAAGGGGIHCTTQQEPAVA